jgi:hypothetical protein
MKKKENGLLRAFKYICLAGVIGFGLMTIISTGGGGDDVGSGGGGEPTFLDVYDYWLTTIDPGHFEISFTEDPDTFTISVKTLNPLWLTGTYNTATEAYTLDSGAGVIIDSDVGVDLLGIFNIEVTSPIQIPSYDSLPTAGAFEVEFGQDSTIVTVVNVPDDGVTLSLNGGQAQFFTWDAFEDLFESAVLEWQRRAALSFSILEFMVQQLDYVVGSIGFIGDNEDELQQNITVTENCDAFPPGKAPGVLEQGTRALTWDDASLNGEVGGGDNFTWSFTDCWDDDPTDDIDDLINGTLDLDSYTEVVDGNNRVTRIGFEGQGGGVVYTNFVVSEVEEDPPGTFTIDPSAETTVNGSFTIVFTE